jgi:preprotein translocase SecE subunit
VAVKNAPEVRSVGGLTRPPVIGLVGTVYVIAALAVVFKLIPSLWWSVAPNTFASMALLGLVMLAAVVGLAAAGVVWLNHHAVKGARAAIFVGVVGVLLILLLTRWFSTLAEAWVYDYSWFTPAVGAILTAAVGLALLAWGVRFFLRPAADSRLIGFENQGWFSTTSYKPLQGLRVRRGTILGLLVIAGCGVYTLYITGSLRRGPENWELNIPFTGVEVVDLTPKKVTENSDRAERERAKKGDAGDARSELEKLGKKIEKRLIDGKEVAVEVAVVNRFTFKEINEQLDPARYYRIHVPEDPNKYASLPRDADGNPPPEDRAWKDRQIVSKNDFREQVRLLIRDELGSGASDKDVEARYEDARKRDTQEPLPAKGTVVYQTIPLLPNVQYTVPILVIALSLWLAWRIVNLPVFADFLIATEAEMNKVSWTTRKRLYQDTIVVLVTVVLMALYLLFMDLIWKELLTLLRVLQFDHDPTAGGAGGGPMW